MLDPHACLQGAADGDEALGLKSQRLQQRSGHFAVVSFPGVADEQQVRHALHSSMPSYRKLTHFAHCGCGFDLPAQPLLDLRSKCM